MRKAKLFLYNALTVAGVGLIIRFSQMAYTVYISGKLGAEGMGLLSLITSVYALAVTFASSGVQLTCTRLIAGALSIDNPLEARRALRGCTVFALCFGLTAFFGLFALSGPVGRGILGEERAVFCLRALCPALPAAALSSCFQGYFPAVRKAYKSSVVSVLEQGARILFTGGAFALFSPSRREVEAVLFSSCSAELFSFFLNAAILYADARRTLPKRGAPSPRLPARICGISLPIAVASWGRAALLTAEHVLIPRGLKKYGEPSALGTYGIMHGMALPVVFFPYAVLTPFTQLLIPEIARFRAQKDQKGIVFTQSIALRATLLFSYGCMALFFVFGEAFGQALYHVDGVGRTVSLFALLIPVMYLDTTVDAILKGMGEQFYCMLVNIGDAALSLILVITLVPRFGAVGYLWTVFAGECFNTLFSFLRLHRLTGVKIPFFQGVLLPAFTAWGTAYFVKLLPFTRALPLPAALALSTPLFVLLYLLALIATRALPPDDRKYFFRLLRGERNPPGVHREKAPGVHLP